MLLVVYRVHGFSPLSLEERLLLKEGLEGRIVDCCGRVHGSDLPEEGAQFNVAGFECHIRLPWQAAPNPRCRQLQFLLTTFCGNLVMTPIQGDDWQAVTSDIGGDAALYGATYRMKGVDFNHWLDQPVTLPLWQMGSRPELFDFMEKSLYRLFK